MLVLGALIFGFYLRTLAPGLLAGDPGEFQFAAWNWGLAHPTGYPLYLIVGGLWQRLLAFFGISPAASLNALSALFGAVAVALLYRLLVKWLTKLTWLERGTTDSQPLLQLVALFGALMLAVNPTFWSQSLIAEVYSLQVLFFVLIFWCFPLGGESDRSLPRGREDAKNCEELQQQELQRLGIHENRPKGGGRALILLAFVAGLALTHHAMSLLLLPCVALTLFVTSRQQLGSWAVWIGGFIALAGPLLLYLYIPLRSGTGASPWYHQAWGSGRLDLYTNGWASFVQFISGRSISVGFRNVGDAVGQLGFAWDQWLLHLSWGGLIMALIGLFMLLRAAFDPARGDARVARQLLLLTVPYALLQQLFNLFYNIGDIYVYYISLYLIGAIWATFGVAALVKSEAQAEEKAEAGARRSSRGIRLGFAVLVLLLPILLGRSFMPQVDQSGNVGTRVRWEEILAANPPDDAILISNDRNEIVPLFYTQFVEERGPSRTGLFPLIAPDGRFTDIGSTIESALQTNPDRPIYLIKPMPGLETRFDIAARTPPLFEVLGGWDDARPGHLVDKGFGPLTLIGYDWVGVDDQSEVVLHWRVDQVIAGDYTTTVQLFDAAGERVAQDDRAAGGAFYGTSRWKVGERLVDRHVLVGDGSAVKMLVGMYRGPTFEALAPSIEIELKN